MVRAVIDHGNDGSMFKTQVESRAVGEWFHCKVLNILLKFAYDFEKMNCVNA